MKKLFIPLSFVVIMVLSFLPVRDQKAGLPPDAADGFIALGPASGHPAEASSSTRAFSPPLLFIENRGQLDPAVRYYLRDGGHTAYFTDTEIVFDARFRVGGAQNRGGPRSGTDTDAGETPALERMVVRMSPVGTAGPSVPRAAEPDRARINVFRGSDPTRWLADIPTYREILYSDVYPGIDLRFYGRGRELRYDFIIRPGADPAQLAVHLTGAESLSQGEGRLVAKGKLGEIVQSGLRAYQRGPAGEEEVEARFRLMEDDVYGFEVGPYDPTLPLVIDPVLIFSTYLGGSGADEAADIEVTSSAVYVCGETNSDNFPTVSAYDSTRSGTDAFVSKFSLDGSSLLFSTFLGGSGTDRANGLYVDDYGYGVWVAGTTGSTNFPTVSPRQATNGGMRDIFLARLNLGGDTLLYSTYHGGIYEDDATGADGGGMFLYISGSTSSGNFPVFGPSGAYQATHGGGAADACVVAFYVTNNSAYYSTFLGGSGADLGTGVAYATGDFAVIAGWTSGGSFPTTSGVVQPSFGGGVWDAFVTKLNTPGSGLQFSTFLGGSDSDTANGVSTDIYGNSYIVGDTFSYNFPTQNAYQSSLRGLQDAFLAKLNASGTSMPYATYFGANHQDLGLAVDVDYYMRAHVTGYTYGSPWSFPQRYPVQTGLTDSVNDLAFVAKFKTTETGDASLISSSLVGANGADDRGRGISVRDDYRYSGRTYVCGWTESSGFPTVNAYQGAQGGRDAFVLRLDDVEIRVEPESVDFGAVLSGSTSSWQTVTVYSDGLSHLTVGEVALVGTDAAHFGIQNDQVSNQMIAPGATKTIQVRFQPTATGSRSAILRFPNNDPDEDPTDVPLYGVAPLPPTVVTWAIGSITQTTATGGGNVTSDGGAAVTARGVCWNTSPNPTTANSKTTNGTGLGTFTSNLTGLTPGTLYYVRAYATNMAGTAYGGSTSFTTLSIALPTVATTAVSAITQTTATSGGNVTSDGGAAVTARGVCWSTSPSPTTANSKTTNGTGTGTFTSSLTGLTPGTMYYVRAYATNSVGTAYGNQESFTTAAALPYEVILPEVIWASATGGGTWVSEVQIIDKTGGSEVSVYFSSSAGRRGPFLVWTGPAADRSVKFTNFLETVDGLDAGTFDYYNKVGAVQFFTQDAAHEIRVSARTVNGDYGKTMQGRTPGDAELADTSRPMMIQNLAGNATYRSSAGFFNPTPDAVTADFTLYGPDGPIGTPFTKSFTGYGYQAFSVFNQAGIPYPGSSYDHAWLLVQPTTGTGKLMCFGATANSVTNDPSAHTAVQVNTGYWNSPSSSQTLPEVIWSLASGGGTWLSEVQITDLTGGSQVSVTFSTNTGVRGPFLLWTGPGANRCERFVNLLQTIDGLDAGTFDYYGKVGAVKFETQDSGHLIHVTARTVNGDYGKTFQGLNNNAENVVSTGGLMMIPDVISNTTYRSSAGFFNTGIGAVAIEYKIYGASGQIGSTFTRDIPAGGFISFRVFEAAGEPYPTVSHDNAWLHIRPTSGTAGIMCFGATANNSTNDPSAHFALRY